MKKAQYLLLFILLFPFCLFSQGKYHSTFTFQSTNSKEANASGYNSMKIYVNNILLEKKDKLYNVKVNHRGLDIIKIVGINSTQTSIMIVTKLKAGVGYYVNFNECSTYEIGPVNRISRARLMRVILLNNDRKKLYFSSENCQIDMDTLQKIDTTNYNYYNYSEYCKFSTVEAGVCTSDPEKHHNDSCNLVYIQFMDNEMYSLIYNCKTHKVSVKFDGYYIQHEI